MEVTRVRHAAEELAGGRPPFRALPKEQRVALLSQAKSLITGLAQAKRREFVPAPHFPTVDRAVIRRAPTYSEKDLRGYVYICFQKAWTDYVKIGETCNLKKRLSNYNTNSPHRDFEFAFFVYCSDRQAAEKTVLANMSAHRARGKEWFKLSPWEALAALQAVGEFDPSTSEETA